MDKPATIDTASLLEFMFRLGQAYLACGEQTAKVELALRRTATAFGVRKSRTIVFPTGIFIALHDGSEDKVTLAEGPTQALRLDQMADVYQLGDAAQRGGVQPKEGLDQLNAILKKPTRFGIVGSIVGHVILTIGLAIVLMPTKANVAAAAILGLIVGVLRAFNRNRPILAVPLPVVAATLVSTLVFTALEYGWPVDPLNALVPPLVAFLPGAMLTLGMVELAYGDMVSGSSRLMTGFVQLILLAFGLAAGAIFVGYRPEDLIEGAKVVTVQWWTPFAPWAGAVVFGIGAYLHFSAPRKSLGWMFLVMLLAFGAQQLALRFFGNVGSGFFGMLVATPVSYLIQLRFRGPPAMVTSLPSFWLLVPGALSLLSVKTMLSNPVAGTDGMIKAMFGLVSIALGSLMGASLYKWLTETFGWWQLQLGRVGRYFRRE